MGQLFLGPPEKPEVVIARVAVLEARMLLPVAEKLCTTRRGSSKGK
jgi:hypothetical protein